MLRFLKRCAAALTFTLIVNACAGLPSQPRTSVETILRNHLKHSPRAPSSIDEDTSLLAQFRAIRFQRPMKQVTQTSPFGPRGKRNHDGVDLRAKEGTPIYAAAEGQVIYVGRGISGYGLTVIVLHANRFSTLYAHASRTRVRLYQKVERGDAIAYAGETGNATSPHLHFELRHELTPLNPGKYFHALR